MSDPETLALAKAHARKSASAVRKRVAAEVGESAWADIARSFAKDIAPAPGTIVSGFLPIGSEIDTRPALENLREIGCEICLPCVVARDTPLVFRLWQEGDELVSEEFGTKAPTQSAKAVEPDMLIVPLLAFDRDGYRLGYGGGFYDRSLEDLRRRKPVQAIGVAYAGQEIDAVPRGAYDEPLDWIVTEAEVLRTGKERVS